MNVVVPFDFKEGVKGLRYTIETYGGTEGVHVYAVHFTQTRHESVDDVVRKEARDLIEEDGDASTIRPDQLTVDVQNVTAETTEFIVPAIEEYAAEHDADQIVMSKHERSLFSRVFDSSNTEQIRESDVAPVTIV